MSNEYAVTTNEIMDFLKESMATKDDIHNLQGQIDKMDGRLDTMDGRLDTMDGRLMRVESQMVTKEYLDDKLADLKGDVLVVLRKEDRILETMQPLISTSR